MILLLQILSDGVWATQGSSAARQHVVFVESSSLILHGTLCDLFVLQLFIDKLEGYHANRATDLMCCTTSETEDEPLAP